MKTLVESLFDKDIITKDPIDFSRFKEACKDPKGRSHMFKTIESLLHESEQYVSNCFVDTYHEYKEEIDFIIEALRYQFDKQKICTWFDIIDNDFEEAGDEMSEEEIDEANEWLRNFYSHATPDEDGGRFVLCKMKIPNFLKKIFKSTGHWFNKLDQLDTWAISYYGNGEQILTFYGCPKNLLPLVKKVLYDR